MIPTHTGAHLDEIAGILTLQMYGGKAFPGVETARVVYLENEPVGTDEQYDADGVIPVGIGRGRFDDKDAQGRRKPHCSMKLIAMHLGLDQNPRLKPLVDEVQHCDSESGVRPTQLASLIKAINRRLGNTTLTIEWTRTAVRAILKHLAYPLAAVSGEQGTLDFFEAVAKRRRFDCEPALAHIRRVIQFGERFERESVTEIGYILRAMQRQGTPRDDVQEWAQFVFTRLYEDQVDFQSTREEFKVDPKTHRNKIAEEILIPVGDYESNRSVRGLIVTSDRKNAHAVAFTLGYKIVVCRRPNGHTQVFVKEGSHLSLRQLTGMIRWYDLPEKWDKSKVSWEQLTVDGECALAARWHYFQGAEMLFNGSDTHPGVPTSRVSLMAVKDAVLHAFHARQIGRWKGMRGIKSSPKDDHRHDASPKRQEQRPVQQTQEEKPVTETSPAPLPEAKEA